MHYSQCFTRFVIDLITMVLRSSYTQSVFSVYPIYTEDIIERYLIKSVNVSGGRAGSASRTSREVRQVGVRAAQAIMGQVRRVEQVGTGVMGVS